MAPAILGFSHPCLNSKSLRKKKEAYIGASFFIYKNVLDKMIDVSGVFENPYGSRHTRIFSSLPKLKISAKKKTTAWL